MTVQAINMKISFFKYLTLLALVALLGRESAQSQPLSEQIAATVLDSWKDSPNLDPTKFKSIQWTNDQQLILEGMDALWRRTANDTYFRYMQKNMDLLITKEGAINNYHTTDHVKNGTTLLNLYKITGQAKYFKAASLCWGQLQQQTRNQEGGGDKESVANQLWLDELYMGQPFYTAYAALINDQKAFDDIANKLILIEKNGRDAQTGLLYPRWDEPKKAQMANQKTGKSSDCWAKAMVCYGMSLVDVLDNFPLEHPQRNALVAILNRFAKAIQKVQNPQTGLWHQILNQPPTKDNVQEATTSSTFVYTIAKAVRKGYLPVTDLNISKK